MPRCPTCKRAVSAHIGASPALRGGEASDPARDDENARFFPFCNQRCKLADLHGWLNDRYVVSDSLPLDESDGLVASSEDE